MNIKVNITDSKKDVIKAGNAMEMFKDVIGEAIIMKGVLIYDKEEPNDKTKELETKTVSCIKRDNGEFISSISPTIENSLNLILGTYSEEEIREGVEVIVKSKKSNSGRDFLYLDLV